MVSDFKLSEQSEFLKSQAVLHTFSALKKVCRYSLRSKQRNSFKNKLFQTPQEVDTMSLPESSRGDYPCYYMDGEDKVTTTYDKLTNVQKQTAKSMLCVDHSAMLFPKPMFMDHVFKGLLFGKYFGGAFDFFGQYDIEKAKNDNADVSINDQPTTNNEGTY
ncbi:hypothetical protein LO80_01415 [Candidatus Francisella endociliophora]|uniref:Uncharacterized protein n=1 Tax=Candidatus Francisella endociliophora TaxID=653937 RepID=A0A097EMI8_9GAMM|nr:hypothetical protein [Francisella sp. FSC1006]AIT08763.1 hypothetical protein LO80_01415 [Francisella sp. FSC1006]